MSELATSSGTRESAARRVIAGARETSYRPLGRTGLSTSIVGFGGYRIDDTVGEHAEALDLALRSGCNLVDTSTNYGDGGSEACVGRVLADLRSREALRRQEVIVVSKAGYLQGSNLERARERERTGQPYPEVVRYAEGCWHCIHPEFLRDQLDASLERLNLPALDVYLLHNPEYFLTDAARRRPAESLADVRDEFYGRIRAAFECLEEQVRRGRIGCYGVSSNTFVSPASDPEATSLSRMLEIASDVGRSAGNPDAHHFSVIQLPLNACESGGVLERNNGVDARSTVLDEARAGGLGVLANRPLNAFRNGWLTRLADFPLEGGGLDVAETATAVIDLEREFDERIAPAAEGVNGSSPARPFHWGEELLGASGRFSGLEHWRQVEREYIRPRLDHVIAHLSLHLVGRVRVDWSSWKDRYRPAIERLLLAVGDRYRRDAQRVSDQVAARLNPHLPARWRGESLSRKAVGLVAGTPGISCVLVGMRRRAYVEDTLGVMSLEPFGADEAAYRAVDVAG